MDIYLETLTLGNEKKGRLLTSLKHTAINFFPSKDHRLCVGCWNEFGAYTYSKDFLRTIKITMKNRKYKYKEKSEYKNRFLWSFRFFCKITKFIFIICPHLWDKFFNVFQEIPISKILLLGENMLITLLLHKARSHTAVHCSFTHKNPCKWKSE